MSWSDPSDFRHSIDPLPGRSLRSATERANRRRLIVFLGVFCVASIAGLAYDFLRPAEYQANARLKITPPSFAAPADEASNIAPADRTQPFLTEVQTLSSRSLLERVADRLQQAGQNLSALGPDPVAGLQAALTVTPVPGTNVVELAATGARPELPTALLVAISEAYREQIVRAFDRESAETSAGVDAEVKSLEARIAAGRRDVGQFAARFEQYKALQSELAQLQTAYQNAQQRRARLEATVRARLPSVQILEQAALPRAPWRPHYWRDAAFVVAGALLLALAAMWIVELFNRPEPHSAVVVAQPVIAGELAQGIRQSLGLTLNAPPLIEMPERPLLEQSPAAPRELSADEVLALSRVADPATLSAMALLLSGISPEEALGLRWSDVDREAGVVHVGGESARTVSLNPSAARHLATVAVRSEAPVLRGAAGQPPTLESWTAQLISAAHDAGLDRIQEVTPAALRHTYLAYLVRQGIRFADLTQVVGQLPSATLATYSTLAPSGPRVARESINFAFPGLENVEPG